jgi:hypothetical protein
MIFYIERSGSADGWNVAYYIFTFLRGVLFFTLVVLIGTGWSYMKPFLGEREARIIMIVIPLQVGRGCEGAGQRTATGGAPPAAGSVALGRRLHARPCSAAGAVRAGVGRQLKRRAGRRSCGTAPGCVHCHRRCLPTSRLSSRTRRVPPSRTGSRGGTCSTWWISSAAAPSCSPSCGPSSTYARPARCGPAHATLPGRRADGLGCSCTAPRRHGRPGVACREPAGWRGAQLAGGRVNEFACDV